MNKDEIIALLQQQISFLQEQLQEANRKADALLEEVTSLRNMLEHKSEEEAKQKRIIKGLAKITQNKSEKQPSTPAPQDAAADQPSEKKERVRTNNGAKRRGGYRTGRPTLQQRAGKTVQDKGRNTL